MKTRLRGWDGTPVQVVSLFTSTDIPVRLRCLACDGQVTIMVATRGRLASVTNPQRDILDEFTRAHAAVQVIR